jgi:hypothetical protein
VWATVTGASELLSQKGKGRFSFFLGLFTLADVALAWMPFPPDALTALPSMIFSFVKLNADLPLIACWIYFSYRAFRASHV